MEQQKIYGYMRVSSKEQNEDRQRAALLEMGVPEKHIYMDKISGKDFERLQYKKLLKKLDCKSVLYIKSIDRLGRNYAELNEQWRIITKEKCADYDPEAQAIGWMRGVYASRSYPTAHKIQKIVAY